MNYYRYATLLDVGLDTGELQLRLSLSASGLRCGYLRHGTRNNSAMVHGLKFSEVNDLRNQELGSCSSRHGSSRGYQQPDVPTR